MCIYNILFATFDADLLTRITRLSKSRFATDKSEKVVSRLLAVSFVDTKFAKGKGYNCCRFPVEMENVLPRKGFSLYPSERTRVPFTRVWYNATAEKETERKRKTTPRGKVTRHERREKCFFPTGQSLAQISPRDTGALNGFHYFCRSKLFCETRRLAAPFVFNMFCSKCGERNTLYVWFKQLQWNRTMLMTLLD